MSINKRKCVIFKLPWFNRPLVYLAMLECFALVIKRVCHLRSSFCDMTVDRLNDVVTYLRRSLYLCDHTNYVTYHFFSGWLLPASFLRRSPFYPSFTVHFIRLPRSASPRFFDTQVHIKSFLQDFCCHCVTHGLIQLLLTTLVLYYLAHIFANLLLNDLNINNPSPAIELMQKWSKLDNQKGWYIQTLNQ